MNIRITKIFYFIYITSSLLVFIVFVFASCVKDFPGLDPAKQISPAPSEEWEPPPEEYPEFFPTEELPGMTPELEPFADELTLSQLVDVALEINPTTLQAWEDAKAAAAAWGCRPRYLLSTGRW